MRFVCVVGLVVAGLLCASSLWAETLVADDFEYFPANSGVHSVSPPGGKGEPLTTVWDEVVYWHRSHAIQIVCDGTAASGNCFLKENFLPAGQGTSELRDHADRAPTIWTPPSEEVWIRHFVRWPTGWEWPRVFSSLKLGRLRLAHSCAQGGPCADTFWGPMHDDPSRLKWTYTFTQDGATWCCASNHVSALWPRGFQTNRWYCIELHLRQNTWGIPPNGTMEMYIDGVLVGANYAVNTRGTSGPGTFAWTMFNITDNFAGIGGPDGNAATTEKTPSVHFDGVVLATHRPACSASRTPRP